MITKREKLQYVYVFLTDLAALAASVILAWLIVGGIMGQLLPYSVLDWVQALVLLVLAYTVTFFCFDQTENIVKRTRGQEAKLSIKSNLLLLVIYSAFLTLSKAVLLDSRYFLVGVVSFNLFLLPAAHGLLKKLLENPELLREMIAKVGGFPFYKHPKTFYCPKGSFTNS